LVLAVVLVVSGCGGQDEQSEPAWFADRQALPSCDAVVLDQGDVVPETATECLFGDNDPSGAELVVQSPTTEGDPVVTYYRRLPGAASLDVMTDMTGDQNGSQGWSWSTCPGATSLTDLEDCSVQATQPR
jgi:hypothetical protein